MSETVEIYNRPARVEAVYDSVARVRFQDNGMLDYVGVDAVPDEEVQVDD